VEILEIVAGPLPARLLGQYFIVVAAFPAAVDGGKILEEEPRAVEKHFQGAVMIRGQGIDARFDIGEVLPPKSTHVREESFTVRNWRVGMGARPRAPARARPLRDPRHGEAVTQIPGDARQLARAIGGARGEAGEGTVHVSPRLGQWRAGAGPSSSIVDLAKHRRSISASR